MPEEPSEKTNLLEKFWGPIIVALIGALGIIIAAVIGIVLTNGASTPTPTPVSTQDPFPYQVRVQAQDTGDYVPDAKVTIEVEKRAPLIRLSDSNGFARFSFDSSYAGKPGLLIVESASYQKHTQNIDLDADSLPGVVLLEPKP